jgi:hypothetical protein
MFNTHALLNSTDIPNQRAAEPDKAPSGPPTQPFSSGHSNLAESDPTKACPDDLPSEQIDCRDVPASERSKYNRRD